jgi:glyoxylase-like metal-dependent hydrolase (beta-lactamase superfamily II)
LVDPLLERVEAYLKLLEQEKWRLSYVIDTHTHADHLSAGPALCDHLGAACWRREWEGKPDMGHSPGWTVSSGTARNSDLALPFP